MNQNILETWKRIFKYSFQGPMVGKEEGEFLAWNDLGSEEREAYKSEEDYNSIVEFCKQ